MEKKTIGAFISALRKANGLTQKQLAEKLNVSDKAVSRWERDEAMPDLTLIPVLAEIFGVTSDELLRGQRRNPDAEPPHSEEKADKQRKRMLADRNTKYKIRSTISVGIALVGLIAVMICNFGFLRAYIGFLVGAVFFVAAAVCQAIFLTLHLSGMDDELLIPKELGAYRQYSVKLSCTVYCAIGTLLALSLPMITLPWDPYQGLEASSWLTYGLLYGLIGFALCWLTSWIVRLILAKRDFLFLSEQANALQKLRLRFTGIFALVMVCLLILQAVLNAILPDLLKEGTVFTDLSSFKEFMETPIEMNWADSNSTIIFNQAIAETIPVESIPSDTENIIHHEDGSVSYFPDDPTDSITDRDGNVLCEFKQKNDTVSSWSVDWDGDTPVITVYTYMDNRASNAKMEFINRVYVLLYLAGALAVFVMYRKKAKILKNP